MAVIKFRAHRAALMAACALVLGACGGESGTAQPTQVAARVNSEEITVHQINTLLSQATSIDAANVGEAGAKVLERLIDQEVLVQKAREVQLDHDPRVLQLIEAARREILARAYVEQVAASAGQPEQSEIEAYYASKPDLFEKRRIYNLQELNIRLEADRHDALRAKVAEAGSLKEVVDWLRGEQIPFAASAGVKAAEQLPMELLPRFAAMKDGQFALVRQPSGATLVHLVSSQTQPIDANRARPLIEKFLSNQRRAEIASEQVRQLRGSAEIAYLGSFSGNAPEAGAAVAEVAATAPGPAQLDGAIEKGVAGLK